MGVGVKMKGEEGGSEGRERYYEEKRGVRKMGIRKGMGEKE